MIDAQQLKDFVPLNDLSDGNLERLAKNLVVEGLPKGTVIFSQGDTDNDSIYLLKGGVEMVSHTTAMKRVIQGGTKEAAFALAPTRPRESTATATTDIRILRIDNNKLDRVLVLDELSTTITQIHDTGDKEFEGDSQWLEEMLQSPAFQNLSKEKLAAVMLQMEPVPVQAGQVVIKQGDLGKDYFVIRKGRFNVSRKNEQGKVQILDELGPGGVFAEESLISGGSPDISIIAMSEGTLMRVSKAAFKKILHEPMLRYASLEQAQKDLDAGAGLVDVRAPQEYQQAALRGSVNIPITELRKQLDKLDPKRRYVLCCKTGVQSEVAAFLLHQRGFDVVVLKGGMQSLHDLD